MFDISWTEFLLIGVVALIVIGPKELPGVLRTLGQWTRKVRSMANEFQNQFQEAMREAEMADLKKEVDDLAKDFRHYDPLKDVRQNVESMGTDFEKSLDAAATPKAVDPATAETAPAETASAEEASPALTSDPVIEPPAEAGAAAAPATEEPAAAPADAAVAPEPAATVSPSTERTG
jgi:sec-independent protein translocase protein TatB